MPGPFLSEIISAEAGKDAADGRAAAAAPPEATESLIVI